jgi:hypothetical protein
MSILVVEVVSEGLIFAADRNITLEDSSGNVSRGTPQPKVLQWPRKDVLFGFVGAATLAAKPVHEWLEGVRGEFASIGSLQELSEKLRDRIQDQRALDEGTGPAQGMIVHVGGFERNDGFWTPRIWHIWNDCGIGLYHYLGFRKQYEVKEEFGATFSTIHPFEIRDHLKVRAKQFQPFWYHQGFDLFTFNILQDAIKSSFRLLCEHHPQHDIPKTLEEWTRHTRMQVLMYGAYFEAFRPEPERFVGGGADIVTLPWP